MTFRKSLCAALFVAASGCAVLPRAADDTSCLGIGDAGCVAQGDASSGDGYTNSLDGGYGDVGAVPGAGARLSLCQGTTTCAPDSADSCNGDAGDASNEACRVALGTNQQTTTMCVASGTGGDGASCTSGVDCAAGFECVGNGTCRHYCCYDSACTAMSTSYETYFCDVATEKSATGAKVPVCMVVEPCQPLGTDTCGSGQTCTVVEIDDSTRLVATCDVMGKGVLGESCELGQCAAGFACIGATGQRTCQELCNTQHPCSGMLNCNTKSQALSAFNVGICG